MQYSMLCAVSVREARNSEREYRVRFCHSMCLVHVLLSVIGWNSLIWLRLAIFDLCKYLIPMLLLLCLLIFLLFCLSARRIKSILLGARDYITSIVHCLCHGHMRTNAIFYEAHAHAHCTLCIHFYLHFIYSFAFWFIMCLNLVDDVDLLFFLHCIHK